MQSKTFIPLLTDFNAEFMIDQKCSLASMCCFCNKAHRISRNTTRKKHKKKPKRLQELGKNTNQAKPSNYIIVDNKQNYQFISMWFIMTLGRLLKLI